MLRNDNKDSSPHHKSPGKTLLKPNLSKKKLAPQLEVIPETNPRGLGSNSLVSHSTTYQPVHSFS